MIKLEHSELCFYKEIINLDKKNIVVILNPFKFLKTADKRQRKIQKFTSMAHAV